MVKKAAAVFFPPDEIDGIIEIIQNKIKEFEVNDEDKILSIEEVPICPREEALQVALRKINQGCCVQYVSDGLKEWLGIEITPEDLDSELATHPDLLPSNQRLRNAWHNIRHVEPESINPIQIQEKYGFDWRYQEYIMEPCEDNEQYAASSAELASTDEISALSEKIIDQNKEAYESLASAHKERSECPTGMSKKVCK